MHDFYHLIDTKYDITKLQSHEVVIIFAMHKINSVKVTNYTTTLAQIRFDAGFFSREKTSSFRAYNYLLRTGSYHHQ